MKLNTETIVATACVTVEAEGYDNLKLQTVADRIGVKTPSLYNHISSLGELRQLVGLSVLESLEDELRAAAIGRAKEEALFAMAKAYRAYATAHPRLYRALIELINTEDSVRAEGRTMMQTLYQVLEPYALGEQGTRHFSRAFRSALHGFVTMQEFCFHAATDADESFDLLVRALIASLETFDWRKA